MLSWGLVKYCKSNNEADIEIFGEAAISMNMFKYLFEMLHRKEFCHKTVCLNIFFYYLNIKI